MHCAPTLMTEEFRVWCQRLSKASSASAKQLILVGGQEETPPPLAASPHSTSHNR